MEFLSDYIGGDISDDEIDNDLFQVSYSSTKTGSDEKDYKSIEDFINQKLKLGGDPEKTEDKSEIGVDLGSEISALEEEVILGAFEDRDEIDETIEGAFESDNDTETEIKSELEDLLKKLD
jgi:hypothetical protein